jgi:hypothetical protein
VIIGTPLNGRGFLLGSILRRPASGIGACGRDSSNRTASFRLASCSVTMPSWPLHVRKPSFAPLRFRSRTYDDRQEVHEHHLSIPTQSGLPARFRSRSAPRAKKSLANQKNARFDRSKTSQLRCSALFKAVFRIVRRAKSSKGKHWEKLRNRKIASTSILTPDASRHSDA